MTSARLLLVCSVCALFFCCAAAEINERTKNMQNAVENLLLMQHAMQSNVNSLLTYVRSAQTAISLENQRRWGSDKFAAKRAVGEANRSTHGAFHGSKFVRDSAEAVHKSVGKVVEVLQEAFKAAEGNEKEGEAMRAAEAWWGHTAGNMSAQLEAAESLHTNIERAKEKMDVAVRVADEKLDWEILPKEVKEALASVLEALEGPRKQTDELSVMVFNARVTLQSAQGVSSGVRLQESKDTQEEKLQEEKLQVVETLKEELEKTTVDGLKTNGTLELKKAQIIVGAEGNTTANEAGAGVSADALPLDGGLPATFHSAALFVPFVFAIAAAAMTTA